MFLSAEASHDITFGGADDRLYVYSGQGAGGRRIRALCRETTMGDVRPLVIGQVDRVGAVSIHDVDFRVIVPRGPEP